MSSMFVFVVREVEMQGPAHVDSLRGLIHSRVVTYRVAPTRLALRNLVVSRPISLIECPNVKFETN